MVATGGRARYRVIAALTR